MEQFYNETLNKLEMAINGLEIETKKPHHRKEILEDYFNNKKMVLIYHNKQFFGF